MAIFDSYTLAELKMIRKRVSKLLSKMDLIELQDHHDVYVTEIRVQRETLQKALNAAADPDDFLDDAIEGFRLVINPLPTNVTIKQRT